jgi:membrane protease YdiL (CAAX protease family)
MTGTDRPARPLLRLLECGVGFFVLPPSLYLVRHRLAFRVVLLTLVLAPVFALYLVRRGGIEPRAFCSPAGLRRHLQGILAVFLPSAPLLGLLAASFLPQHHLLGFPVQAPVRWALVMLLYPVLAAYPQELIFRAFFFHRYRCLFPNDLTLVIANGVSFGLAHLLFGNWIAVVLSTLGGLLFAYRYLRTGSLLAVSLEHGLWGDFLFTVGLGRYLYSGSIR